MKTFLMLLAILSYPTFGQNILIKMNGDTQPFRKIKFHDGYVEIRQDKEKIKINEDDVMGYYDEDFQTIYYKKLIVHDLEEALKILPDKRKKQAFECELKHAPKPKTHQANHLLVLTMVQTSTHNLV